MDWAAYFARMKDWKRLPAYRAEPRIDSLVGHFLPRLLPDLLGLEVRALIPELPLRKGTLRPEFVGTVHAERSWKVDFLAVGTDRNWLIEFKTASGSRRDQQDAYLEDAVNVGTRAVLGGIAQIARSSTYKAKYAHLLSTLQQAELLDAHQVWTGKNPAMEILFVQPSPPKNGERGLGFEQIADWLEAQPSQDGFMTAFADALRCWAAD